eukprot:c1446_g1_i1 orf=43-552(+)
MGITIVPGCAMPKLVLAAAIPLGILVSLYMFLCNTVLAAAIFMRGGDYYQAFRRGDDHQAFRGGYDHGHHTPASLEEELADDEWEETEASSAIEAVQASLPSVRYESVDEGDVGGSQACAVCLSEMRNGEEVRRMRHCRHLFHTPCIDSWLLCKQRTCPLCRASLLAPL